MNLNRTHFLILVRVLVWVSMISLGGVGSIGCAKHGGSDLSIPTVPKGNRVLGLDFADTTQSGTYVDNTAKAKAAGASATSLSLQWNQIETSPGSFTDPGGVFATANAYYPANQISLTLTIRSIDTATVPVPADLSGVAFNQSTLINRYNTMIDWVLTRIHSVNLTALQVANEIDVNSISTGTFWTQYQSFMSQVVAHVHAVKPGLKVGFTVTSAAAIGSFKAQILNAAQAADLVGVTYYPLNPDFTVKSPNSVIGDFTSVMTAFGSKPVYFMEVGCPTGTLNNSSEAIQAQFVQNVFTAWDLYSAQIPYLSFVRLVDYSPANAQSIANNYGLGGNAIFVSYLQTLGLRTYTVNGTDKSALTTLQSLVSARGF